MLLRSFDLEPGALTVDVAVDVAESEFARDFEQMLPVIGEVRHSGVQVALSGLHVGLCQARRHRASRQR